MNKIMIVCQSEPNPFDTTRVFSSILEARKHFRDIADKIPAESTVSGLQMKIGEISADIVLLPLEA